MGDIAQCLQRIEQVRRAAADDRSAYLIRTRLHRMLMSTQNRVDAARRTHVVEQVRPGSDHSVHWDAVERLTRQIVLETRHMSQRSESLDDRWTECWRRLSAQLDELELLLRAPLLAASDRTPQTTAEN